MRVFHPTYRTRAGEKKQTAKYHVEFRDHLDRVRRLAAFSDRDASEEFGRKVEKLVASRATGRTPDRELDRFLEALPGKILERFVELDLVAASRVAATRPLADMISTFEEALRARGRTEKHIGQTVTRAKRVFSEASIDQWTQIDPHRVEAALARMREREGLGLTTSNHHLTAARAFTAWAVRTRLATEDPLRGCRPMNARVDRRRVRRPLSEDEVRSLLEATAATPARHGVSGAVRALIYRLVVESGLRAGEIKSLRVSSFDNLSGDGPTVRVEAKNSKHRREDTLPLLPGLARALAAHLSGRKPWEPAFELPAAWRAAKMLQEDLKVAKIKAEDESGRVVDFHALRATFCTLLARANVPPKIAQTLARHSSIQMTFDVYAKTDRDDEVRALGALPDFGAGADSESEATGTEGTDDLAPYLASGAAEPCTSVHSPDSAPPPDDTDNADRGSGGGTRTPDTRIMIPLL